MNGLSKCETCEISIPLVRAEGRGWTKIEVYIPRVGQYQLVVVYYCDACWRQQQARMFG